MPHITVKWYKGRSEEQKKAFAEAIAKEAARLLDRGRSIFLFRLRIMSRVNGTARSISRRLPAGRIFFIKSRDTAVWRRNKWRRYLWRLMPNMCIQI